jgi:hypothetical protein
MITIDGYPLDLVETEQHELSAEVTQHPVEDGGNVSDNVIVKPRELTFTNAVVSDTPIGAIAADPTRTQLTQKASDDAYARLEATLLAKQPVVVVTRLKKYPTMILDKLSVTQTAKEAGGLVFTAHFTEVNIVTNKRVTVSVPNAAGKKNYGTKTSSLWAKKFGIKNAIFVITFGHRADGSVDMAQVAVASKSFGPPVLTDKFGAHFEVVGATRPDGYVKDKTYYPINATGQDIVERDQFGNPKADEDKFGNLKTEGKTAINGEPVNWDPEDRTWRDANDNHVVKSYPPDAKSPDFWKDVTYTPPAKPKP